jgi:myo-inositol-1(or 4)-monophosphatase
MIELARESGEFILPYFGNHDIVVDTKAEDDTPVTIADRGAEELLRQRIRKRYPSHGIIGEEFGSENAEAEFVWLLDPVDGTKAFISAVPLFGTLIGLMHKGHPVLGCIHQPVLKQLLLGDGNGTTLNGNRVSVRKTESLSEATLLTSETTLQDQYSYGEGFVALAKRCRLVRTWGDCYGYLLLASGWADIMCDPGSTLWDMGPLIPIVRGAGGVVTDWQGRDPMSATTMLATTPGLHAQVVSALKG